MPTEVVLPNLGESVDSGDVLNILVNEGDLVTPEQGILEIETEKATVEVPSPSGGRVAKIHVSEGDTIKVGSLILTLDEAGNGAPAKEAPAKDAQAKEPAKGIEPKEEPAAKPARKAEPAQAKPPEKKAVKKAEPTPSKRAERKAAAPEPELDETEAEVEEAAEEVMTGVPETSDGGIPGDGRAATAAGPAVRRLARELGVDLRRVRGSGEGGRITREDVQAYVRETNRRTSTPQPGVPVPPGAAATDEYGPVRREKMSRMRQTIARNMHLSYTTIPQLTNFDDADITELEKIRQESMADYAKRGIKLTTMPFLVKAIASALKLHPVINASIDEENNQIVYKEYVNLGVAVDTERGLLVPVIRNIDQMTISQIARELQTLAEKARAGKQSLEDLRGGTFTISNLGAIGGTYSTPIINPPEVAIVLAGRSRLMPMYVGEKLEPRLMMPLSITYDHRVVDGAAAARFLNEVKGYLSAPGRLLLAP